MYTSYLTRETFENEHDEKMTRKFSYNYQVLKRLFPEVYKLPESEIRSLVHSIYDNPKLGDELLDHLTDVINKKKPEWGEYLNPKPEEPEQPVQSVQQDNPLQPVQSKPLSMSSGFEPYKPQKSAFGLGIANDVALNNSGKLRGLNNTGGLNQTKLPDFTKGMDLKHSDMVTGFGINEAKQKEMFGTGFQMPKLPKMPTFPKAPEPQMPEMPQTLQFSPAPQFQQPTLVPQLPQTEMAYSTYTTQTPMAWAQVQNNSYVDPTYDAFEELKKYLLAKERMIQYPYLDKKAKDTVCIGHMDESRDDFEQHPWRYKGTEILAPKDEVKLRLNRLGHAKNHKATYYEHLTGLEVPKEYCTNLLENDIAVRDRELAQIFPNYDKLSQAFKNVLMDIHYTSNIRKWKHLQEAVAALDKNYICNEIHRKEAGRPDMISRNQWAAEQCNNGFFLK